MSNLPPVFLPYQQRLMTTVSESAVTVVEKSRRTGYSWAAAAIAVMSAGAERAAGGQDVFYMGYNLEMAREFIDYVGTWAKQLQPAAVEVEEYLFTDPDNPEKDIKAFRVAFASGFKVVALPSVPRALRGMQGLVIIDEAAFHDNLPELLKAAFALLIWGGKVLVISTHDGDTNAFNELVTDIRAGRRPYALLRCTFDDALGDGLYRRICYVGGQTWSVEAEAAWRQEIVDFYGAGADEELFCIPAQGSGTVLPTALIEARMDAAIPVVRWSCNDAFTFQAERLRQAEAMDFCERELKPLLAALDAGLMSFFGQDFGRSGDLSVNWPLQLQPNLVRRAPFVVELHNVPFEQQKQILFYVVDRLPRFMAGALDATGNGAYLAEVAAQRYGESRIAQIKLSAEWYRENMPPFVAAFEDGMVALPKDADTLADHRALRRVKGVAMVPRDAREAGADGKQRHGDSAIAHALAHFASRMDVTEYAYTPAGASGGADADNDDDAPQRFRRGAW